MPESHFLINQYLIAMPGLADQNFANTVTYVCEHSEDGALGIVVNRPSELHLSDLMRQMDLDPPANERFDPIIFHGGPMSPERGFVLHPREYEWEATIHVSGDVSVSSSRDALISISRGDGPKDYLISLGYAGWGPGQLEQEILSNAWLNVPAKTEIMFQTPATERWQAAAALIGIDLDRLSSDAGHA
ncbi:MAG: YqgE/AlgH family protein [Pseudomonadota bacterium]|nr:YqgE/AlgH family protein [Pseudomonadota bacterium]